MIRFIGCCVLWVGLCVANSFAMSDPESPNDLRAGAPVSVREPQPDGFIPRNPGPAVPSEQNADLLTLVREANEDLYSSLQSFVCKEEMRRFMGRINGQGIRQIDAITAKVSFENGVEHYTEIRQNERDRASISNIPGAWSTGEFGTLLLQTQILLKTQPVVFRGNADLDGTATAIYTVDISEQNSPWDLVIRSEHFRIPFRTKIWVSKTNGHVLKIERASMGVPEGKGISGIHWGVTLEPVEMNGKSWLLPSTGEYTVLYEQSGRREWNEITFSNYHRYGSEVALRFQ